MTKVLAENTHQTDGDSGTVGDVSVASEIEGRVGTFVPSATELNEVEIRRDFGGLIEGAMQAFQHDPSYIVDMAEHASLIAYKRALWEVRMQVQRAEQAAQKQCRLDSKECPFACSNVGACGFGTCRYATEENATVSVTSEDGDRDRPDPLADGGKYRIEDTIAAVLRAKNITAPAKLSRGSRRKNRQVEAEF